MARSGLIVAILATLVLAIGGPGLAVMQAGAAEMMEADKAMMKATGEDLMALKNELAAVQAELQRLTARIGTMSQTVQKTAEDYCQSIPESLKRTGFAPGPCAWR